MKLLLILALAFVLLSAGCISVPSGTKNVENSNTVPATTGGTDTSGNELPPLPPDNELVAGSTVTITDSGGVNSEEMPPLPE